MAAPSQEDDDDWDKDSNDGQAAEKKQQQQPLPQQKSTVVQNQAEAKTVPAAEEDDHDWDKDINDGQAAEKKPQQPLPQQKSTVVKKQAEVKSAPVDIPTAGVSEKAEACDWDSDGEEEKVKIPEGPVVAAPKKAEPAKAQKPAAKPHIPEEQRTETVEASGWDDDDTEAAKPPAGKLEPSGFDDEPEQKKAVALVFDMSPEKPRKEMPKHLQERLSQRPKSAKKTRNSDGEVTTEPIDKKEFARQMRKKSRTIVAPQKEKKEEKKKEEKKEEQRALPPPRMKPHMANRAMAMNKPNEEIAGTAVAA